MPHSKYFLILSFSLALASLLTRGPFGSVHPVPSTCTQLGPANTLSLLALWNTKAELSSRSVTHFLAFS